MIFYTGLAVVVLSRIIDGNMPDPITGRLFFDLDDDEDIDSSVEEVTEEENKDTDKTVDF